MEETTEKKEKIIKELSALDLHYLIKEFEILKNSKVENIYQKEGTFYFILHVSGQGKKILKIMLPSFLYITEYKEEMPDKPPQFCLIIRKYLKNIRLREIEQIDFERILKLTFNTKEDTYYLIIELFSKGNVILCNKDMKIIYPLTHQKWKDRVIKGGQFYKYPLKPINIFNITLDDLKQEIEKTEMDSIVTFLAKEIGLGGKYAEIICEKSNIDKNLHPKEIEIEIMFNSLKNILNEEKKLNNDLDLILTEKTVKENKEKHEKKFKENKSKTTKILEMQEDTVKKQEKLIQENTLKGELIYNNYNKISNIISEINEIRKKHSWSDIKEKLKNHAVIKKINDKTGKITIEIN
jgi:predicted ribosome quality control (RQC) complex YloA/Tae2 family protein